MIDQSLVNDQSRRCVREIFNTFTKDPPDNYIYDPPMKTLNTLIKDNDNIVFGQPFNDNDLSSLISNNVLFMIRNYYAIYTNDMLDRSPHLDIITIETFSEIWGQLWIKYTTDGVIRPLTSLQASIRNRKMD